jgi:glycosyltransferase involved in cell wall biosynthesis
VEATSHSSRPRSATQRRWSAIDVSVVIPCFDAAPSIGSQLEALATQRGAPPFEVVVVDDGSSDGSRAVVEQHRRRLPDLVLIADEHRGNVAAVRNLGVAHARGDLLLFCDADDVVAGDWVARMTAALRTHPFVAGPFELARLNPPWAVAAGNLTQTAGLQHDGFLPFAGGGNLGMRREVFDAVGGFDPSLPALEDTDLCFRAQLAGYELAFAADAVVHVRLRRSFRALFRQGLGWGYATVGLHARYREQGMPLPSWLRHLGGWLLVFPRLLLVRDRAQLGRWCFALGWRIGRLRGNVRYRLLVF